ncbi:Translocation protein SEC62 [Aphelenchoides bicaudatus]|nr:Translocation protein SEC62 [Aphelenchoides bicaudatus]
MADRRRKGQKGAKTEQESDKMPKETEAIAKFLRFNCPTKMAMYEGNEVHYFTGRKAVDTLVDSKKYGAGSKEPRFANSAQAEDFLADFLASGLFFRAKILVAKKKEDPRRSKRDEVKESPRVKRIKDGDKDGDSAAESGVDKKDETKKEEEKRKKKVKVVAHDQQVFNNDTDVYVWVFVFISVNSIMITMFLVFGVILACLFPLWPDWLRLVVYYLSVTGISLFGLLLGVAFLRTVLFCVIYAATWGRHNLWILPNLTEDCGFFESFQPFYTYEYVTPGENADKKKKKKRDGEEDPLIEDVEEKSTPKPAKDSKKQKKQSTPPPDPHTNKKSKKQQQKEEEVEDETDPDEKYSKSGSDDSAAEEDEVTENDEAATGSTGSNGDSEPVNVKIDTKTQKVEDPEPSPNAEAEDSKPAGGKSRRRRVRRADDDYVMVQSGEGH